MNWNTKDISLFIQQREYIDTAIVPLAQTMFGKGIMQSAEQYEFIGLMASFLEKQFKGRLLITPPCTYLENDEEKLNQAANWGRHLAQEGFQHIIFLTSDSYWHGRESELGTRTSVIWVPSVPLGSMEDSVKYSVIENSGKQLVHLIIEKWQKQM